MLLVLSSAPEPTLDLLNRTLAETTRVVLAQALRVAHLEARGLHPRESGAELLQLAVSG
jgi:hypothetical protein